MYDPADIVLPDRREGDLEAKPPHYLEHFTRGVRTSGTTDLAPSSITDEQWREIIAHTYGMVTLIDDSVGRVLGCLEEEGLAANTLVVFTTDHGDLLGDHGLLLKGPFNLSGLLRTPLIWRLPGVVPEGRRLDGLCGTVDLMQTVLDVVGVAPPPGRQGVSLRDYLVGRGGPQRDWLLVENDEDYLDVKLRTLITREWQLTAYGGKPYGELYDRQADPGEFVNLWDSPRCRDVRADLMGRLADVLICRDDPLPPRYVHA
jgi:arylsulfatase A-like enzyme